MSHTAAAILNKDKTTRCLYRYLTFPLRVPTYLLPQRVLPLTPAFWCAAYATTAHSPGIPPATYRAWCRL